MNPWLLTALSIAAAYLIGSVPFAYILVRLLKGIDIRTVGSGNVGATNASRVLGLRYFFVVFALDLLKGYLPTFGSRYLADRAIPELPVLVALATILGHNFPIYLGFRGGKGVATSLGVALALDPLASGVAVVVFLVFLYASKYVSLSSLAGGLAFAAAYFAQAGTHWWDRNQRAMTLLVAALIALLFIRHRSNLVRIARGTEPKLKLGGRRRDAGAPETDGPKEGT